MENLAWLLAAAAVVALAVLLLRRFQSRAPRPEEHQYSVTCSDEPNLESPRVVYFDLETMRGPSEVGGWGNAHLMGIASGVVWDSQQQQFSVYSEASGPDLIRHLFQADLVVGFNSFAFDYRVISGYLSIDVAQVWPSFDLLTALDKRTKLDNLARATLGVTKTASGRQSLRWVKEGRLDLVAEYCQKDVAILRDLFNHALEHGFLLAEEDRGGESIRLETPWVLSDLIQRAWSRIPARSEMVRKGEPVAGG